MTSLRATWKKLCTSEVLKRSSQVIAAFKNQGGSDPKILIFGGELLPRQPRDNEIHILSLKGNSEAALSAIPSKTSAAPIPRVGSAAAVPSDSVYIFSGRGGVDMAPIEENGALWAANLSDYTWSIVEPISGSPYPPARSYHCMISDRSANRLYVHAGCPSSGRLSDLWSFNISTKQWTQHADAPAPPRGGTSITFSGGKLYRMNGFDGKTEQGGSLDIYDPKADTWSSVSYVPDGVSGPEPRSVSALLALKIHGKENLVTLFGEHDPSSLGHQGAGKMLGDVWAFDLSEAVWRQVVTEGEAPQPRGWFAADVVGDQQESIVVTGGLSESNERLDDAWELSFT